MGGLRKGEVWQLTESHQVRPESGRTIRAETTKSRKARKVYLPEELRSYLQEHPPNLPNDRPFAPHDFERLWVQLRGSANLEHRPRFHDLRHTFATNLLRRGGNIKSVQTALGHSSLIPDSGICLHPSTATKGTLPPC